MKPNAILLALLSAGFTACHPHHTPVATSDAVADAAPRSEAGGAGRAPVDAAVVPADDALPAFVSEELTTRAKHLLEAIQKDDGELAGDIVFPRDAYLAVKDVADPGKDWDKKVRDAFLRQVHVLHHRTKGIERAVFTSFELGQPAGEAMPKKKDLRRMLWRSKRSRLGFTVDGKPNHFDIVEMTGWRGAWYVTKLK